jgi:hypothetical protein
MTGYPASLDRAPEGAYDPVSGRFPMRFTWVALPVLLATLAPAPGAASTEENADDEQSRSPVVRVAAEVARPSQGPSRQLAAETIVRDPSLDGSSSASADVHLRVIRVASLDFSTRVCHSVSGFLPSYSTACPPPAA